jgi:DNA polymerase III delta subunit
MRFFKASSGRVYYIKKNAKSVSEEYIERQLAVLSETELKIKKGLLDKKVGLEMFILNI